jgi:hypothetical protein
VKFDEEGTPCIDKAFLENAGLIKQIKEGLPEDSSILVRINDSDFARY